MMIAMREVPTKEHTGNPRIVHRLGKAHHYWAYTPSPLISDRAEFTWSSSLPREQSSYLVDASELATQLDSGTPAIGHLTSASEGKFRPIKNEHVTDIRLPTNLNIVLERSFAHTSADELLPSGTIAPIWEEFKAGELYFDSIPRTLTDATETGTTELLLTDSWISELIESHRRAQVDAILPTMQRISEIVELEPDWNGYGARPTTSSAVAAASLILVQSLAMPLYDGNVAVDAAPLSDGGVIVEWDAPERRLQIWFHGDGRQGGVEVDVQDGKAVDWRDISIENEADVLDHLVALVDTLNHV